MRTALNLPRSRRPRKIKKPHLHCTEALRACELAAVRLKCAGDELTAHWIALIQEATDGAEMSDLLRARAWCQTLTTQLKERLNSLHQTSQALDHAWRLSTTALGQPWPVAELGEASLPEGNLPILANLTSPSRSGLTRKP